VDCGDERIEFLTTVRRSSEEPQHFQAESSTIVAGYEICFITCAPVSSTVAVADIILHYESAKVLLAAVQFSRRYITLDLRTSQAGGQTVRRPGRSRRMTAARVIASVAASSSLVDRAEWPSRDPARLATGQRRRARSRRRRRPPLRAPSPPSPTNGRR